MKRKPYISTVTRGAIYARGAADLARLYQEHGARSKFAPSPLWTGNWARSRMGFGYRAGYYMKNARLNLGLDKPSRREPVSMKNEFRQWFSWTIEYSMQISTGVIYWFRDEGESIVVHIQTKQRLVLNGVSDFIWRRIANNLSRETIVAALSEHYTIALATALADLDDFVEELIAAQVLIREKKF